MQVFHHKEYRLFSGPHLLGVIFTLAGTASILSPLFVQEEYFGGRTTYTGLAFLILGVVVLSKFSGYSIDFTGKKFRRFQSILGFRYGDWNPLPKVSKVEVRTVSYEQTNTPNGVSPTLSGEVKEHHVILLDREGEPILNLTHKTKKQAEHGAKHLRVSLDKTT